MFTNVIFCSQDCANVDKYVDKRSKLWISSNEAIHVLLLSAYYVKLSAGSLIRIESHAFFSAQGFDLIQSTSFSSSSMIETILILMLLAFIIGLIVGVALARPNIVR